MSSLENALQYEKEQIKSSSELLYTKIGKIKSGNECAIQDNTRCITHIDSLNTEVQKLLTILRKMVTSLKKQDIKYVKELKKRNKPTNCAYHKIKALIEVFLNN